MVKIDEFNGKTVLMTLGAKVSPEIYYQVNKLAKKQQKSNSEFVRDAINRVLENCVFHEKLEVIDKQIFKNESVYPKANNIYYSNEPVINKSNSKDFVNCIRKNNIEIQKKAKLIGDILATSILLAVSSKS